MDTPPSPLAHYCIDDLISDEVTENANLGSQLEKSFHFLVLS
jgi:hypothetical protein